MTAAAYQEAWAEKMVQIWTDRILMAGAVRTGTLLRSVRRGASSITDAESLMTFRFVQYGLYVDRGTGRGYTRGNGGDIQRLGRDYKGRDKMKQREKTRWFTRSWNISLRVLANYMSNRLGKEYLGLFDDLFDRR